MSPPARLWASMRRYWHPIALSTDALSRPVRVRVLGEDLIVFRAGDGTPGLFYPCCCHRGADLYYGRTEFNGLRCCYHGRLFEPNGRCAEMPMEPDLGERRAQSVRQPWYPVRERYGLIFAYIGPEGRMPALARYEMLEQLTSGEELEADATSIGNGGDVSVPCNWLQHYENVMDPFHVPVLHEGFSGTQFVADIGAVPTVRFESFEYGVRSHQFREFDDGRKLHRITECVGPTVRVVANPSLTPEAAPHWGGCCPLIPQPIVSTPLPA
jgi:phenylpropionate dioxygenase-like ring-hydroxylating dioxygenase large terminal subunit